VCACCVWVWVSGRRSRCTVRQRRSTRQTHAVLAKLLLASERRVRREASRTRLAPDGMPVRLCCVCRVHAAGGAGTTQTAYKAFKFGRSTPAEDAAVARNASEINVGTLEVFPSAVVASGQGSAPLNLKAAGPSSEAGRKKLPEGKKVRVACTQRRVVGWLPTPPGTPQRRARQGHTCTHAPVGNATPHAQAFLAPTMKAEAGSLRTQATTWSLTEYATVRCVIIRVCGWGVAQPAAHTRACVRAPPLPHFPPGWLCLHPPHQIAEEPTITLRYECSEALLMRRVLNPRNPAHRALLRKSANPGERGGAALLTLCGGPWSHCCRRRLTGSCTLLLPACCRCAQRGAAGAAGRRRWGEQQARRRGGSSSSSGRQARARRRRRRARRVWR
jgi:hypothetical protein